VSTFGDADVLTWTTSGVGVAGALTVSGQLTASGTGTAISAPNGTAAFGGLSAGGIVKANATTGQLAIAASSDLPGGPYLPLSGGTLSGSLQINSFMNMYGNLYVNSGYGVHGAGWYTQDLGMWATTNFDFGGVGYTFNAPTTFNYSIAGTSGMHVTGPDTLSALGAGFVQANASGVLSSTAITAAQAATALGSQAAGQIIVGNGATGVTSNSGLTASTNNLTSTGVVTARKVVQTLNTTAVSTSITMDLSLGNTILAGSAGVPGALTAATTWTFSNASIGSTSRIMFRQGTTSFAVTFAASGYTFYQNGKTAGVASGSVVLAAADMVLSQYYTVEIAWLSATTASVSLLKT
jgi:hypothetical protein